MPYRFQTQLIVHKMIPITEANTFGNTCPLSITVLQYLKYSNILFSRELLTDKSRFIYVMDKLETR